jgi:hypothetical protein
VQPEVVERRPKQAKHGLVEEHGERHALLFLLVLSVWSTGNVSAPKIVRGDAVVYTDRAGFVWSASAWLVTWFAWVGLCFF